MLDGNGIRHAGSLHGNSTTDHLAGHSVRYLITGNAAPRDQEVVHLLWNRDHIGNLNVSPGRWYDDDTVAVLFVN
ncbi:MAG: hypothetical protein PVJ22_18565 [Desulfobacterales bacterium]